MMLLPFFYSGEILYVHDSVLLLFYCACCRGSEVEDAFVFSESFIRAHIKDWCITDERMSF